MALRTYLAMNPGIALATWVSADRALVDLLRIPERSRRRGLGSRIYRMWEATLPDGMLVELFAVDMDATAFWRSLGFEGEDNGVMVKRVSRTRMAMAA
jgi:N-acetylglutamate synthase-like GNAT family acetyltransferase